MEMLGIYLIVWIVCGTITAAIASAKGRNVAGWFFVGFFGGIIGIIVGACMSNLKYERAYREQIESEQRRLREQLRQERIKTESLRQFSTARLDSHDRILGVDTRTGVALPAGTQSPLLTAGGDGNGQSPPLTPEEALARMAGGTPPQAAPLHAVPPVREIAWYYEVAGAPIGPVTEQEIRGLIRVGRVNARTLLWCEDLGSWTSANMVDPFRSEALS